MMLISSAGKLITESEIYFAHAVRNRKISHGVFPGPNRNFNTLVPRRIEKFVYLSIGPQVKERNKKRRYPTAGGLDEVIHILFFKNSAILITNNSVIDLHDIIKKRGDELLTVYQCHYNFQTKKKYGNQSVKYLLQNASHVSASLYFAAKKMRLRVKPARSTDARNICSVLLKKMRIKVDLVLAYHLSPQIFSKDLSRYDFIKKGFTRIESLIQWKVHNVLRQVSLEPSCFNDHAFESRRSNVTNRAVDERSLLSLIISLNKFLSSSNTGQSGILYLRFSNSQEGRRTIFVYDQSSFIGHEVTPCMSLPVDDDMVAINCIFQPHVFHAPEYIAICLYGDFQRNSIMKSLISSCLGIQYLYFLANRVGANIRPIGAFINRNEFYPLSLDSFIKIFPNASVLNTFIVSGRIASEPSLCAA